MAGAEAGKELWVKVFDIAVLVVILSIFLERALALPFESRWWIERRQALREKGARTHKGVKEAVCFLCGFLLCKFWKVDAMDMLLPGQGQTIPGFLLTGAVIAGGSKASIRLFNDLLDAKSNAKREKENT